MKKVKLSEIADIIAGQSPPSHTYNKDGMGLPFFQGKADFGEWYPKTRIWCSEPKKIAEKGDILISVRAPVGPTNINYEKSCIGRGLSAIRCKTELIDRNYLVFFLRKFEIELSNLGSGSTFNAITQKELKNLQIPLSPLSEQKRIAGILDKADSLRQTTRKLIEHYDQLAQSLFLDMFGDPVTNPMGWEKKSIEEMIANEPHSLRRGPFGGALKKEIFVDEGYLVFEQYHALNKDFKFARYYITEKKFEELKSFSVKPGDIIISCSGVNLGRLAIVPKDAKKGVINQALLKIKLDKKAMNSKVFEFIFENKNFKSKYFGNQRGSGIPNFPPISTFKKFEFIVPPINTQNQFAEKIKLIEKQKELAQNSLAESENLFQALMQKAFKGEL